MDFGKSAQAAAVIVLSTMTLVAASVRSSRAEPSPTTLRSLYGLERPAALPAAKTAVLLIDYQEEFVHGRLPLSDVDTAIERGAELASWARRSGILVVLVQNVVNRAGSPIFAPDSKTTSFVPELAPQPGDMVVQKSVAGAFSRTPLDANLRARGIEYLIVGGLMTHLAVLNSASEAAVLGYRVIVAADATATRALPGPAGEGAVDAPTLKRVALATMADRAADVMQTRAVMELRVTR